MEVTSMGSKYLTGRIERSSQRSPIVDDHIIKVRDGFRACQQRLVDYPPPTIKKLAAVLASSSTVVEKLAW
jgi:hypothetical protein